MILDHIAIAVKNIEDSIDIYEKIGLEFSSEREVVESQKVTTAFAQIDQHAHLELLSPIGEDGPISKYIAKRGPGIHHLCFKVEDIEKKCIELKNEGFILLNESPVVGAGGAIVNFIHPKSTGGVLIELSQKK